ncbi:MAG: RDD family protein [Deltaproteobacteria bacterium]|nr:RDD family protein [Deltaproteobacteria bacterium]
MIDPFSCPACSFANAPGAETCGACGAALAETPERVPPGETRRDPDDLTLPSSPLLRAVLRGEPNAFTRPTRAPAGSGAAHTGAAPSAPAEASAAASATPPPAIATATIEQLHPRTDQAALLRELAERLHARRAEPSVRYAGFLVRVVAFVVDGALLGAFALPLAAAGSWGVRAGMLVLGHPAPVESDEVLLTLLVIGWFAMATAYFTVLHGGDGQTIGKSFCGIAVRTLHLRRVGVVRALFRTIAYAFSSSFFGFGFFLVALTPRKRGWHDFLAGTCVVRLGGEEASS